jgi:hypothetical protein
MLETVSENDFGLLTKNAGKQVVPQKQIASVCLQMTGERRQLSLRFCSAARFSPESRSRCSEALDSALTRKSILHAKQGRHQEEVEEHRRSRQ